MFLNTFNFQITWSRGSKIVKGFVWHKETVKGEIKQKKEKKEKSSWKKKNASYGRRYPTGFFDDVCKEWEIRVFVILVKIPLDRLFLTQKVPDWPFCNFSASKKGISVILMYKFRGTKWDGFWSI